MAEKYKLAKYPQDKYRFSLFDNIQRYKTTTEVVKAHPGAVGAINLWYFALKDQPSAGVRYWDHQAAVMISGVWACKPTFAWPGLCIDADGKATAGYDKDATYDYTASVQADYIDEKRTNTTAWGRNGVTYTGFTADGTLVAMVCSKDSGMTSIEAVEAMLKAGCVTIMRWDGSWSSQGQLLPGVTVKPSQNRPVRGWLIIYPREGQKEEDEPMGTIKNYLTNNDCYQAGRTITPKGIMAHSPGVGQPDVNVFLKTWNIPGETKCVHAFVHKDGIAQTLPWNYRGWHAGTGTGGKSANDTHISFEICEPEECNLLPVEWRPLSKGGKYNTTWAVKRLQMELQARGYDPKGVDGNFGPGCEAALKACQKALGLAADGSCGPTTLTALAKRAGSYLAYNVQTNEPYFRAVWNNAVTLCAERCKQYSFDPMKDILCHAEGYKKGIASNHADVMHWFPLHGESMDTFRAAVKAAMSGAITPPSVLEPLPLAVDKLISKGIILPENANYWKGGNYSAANVQALIIKTAAVV